MTPLLVVASLILCCFSRSLRAAVCFVGGAATICNDYRVGIAFCALGLLFTIIPTKRWW